MTEVAHQMQNYTVYIVIIIKFIVGALFTIVIDIYIYMNSLHIKHYI